MTSTWSHIENEFSVAGKSLADAPSAFVNELQDDWKNHKGQLLLKNAEAFALGAGMAIAFKAAPMATLVGTGLPAGYAGLRTVVPAVGEAWNANTEDQRNALGIKYGGILGHTSATIVETAPGLILGGKAGTTLFERSSGVRNLTYKFLYEPVEKPMQDFAAFHGRGVGQVAPMSADGTINATELSKVVPTGAQVEQARAVDLQTGKVSKIFNGTADQVKAPIEANADRIMVHTHLENAGPRPGLVDISSTPQDSVGIIRSGNYRSVFMGQKGVAPGTERLQTLIVDDTRQSAFLLDVNRGSTYVWKYAKPQYVDYQSAAGAFERLNLGKAWSQIKALPAVENSSVIADHLKIAAGKPFSSEL